MKTNETFEQHLKKSNLSENTIHSYLWTVDFYHAHYDEISKKKKTVSNWPKTRKKSYFWNFSR